MENKRNSISQYLLLLILIIVGAYLAYDRRLSYQQIYYEAEQRKIVQKQNDITQVSGINRFGYLATHYRRIEVATDSNRYHPPIWIESEAKKIKKIIKDKKYDYIVMPMQGGRLPGYDQTSRILTARILANDVEKLTGKEVMSPELVQRLLGTGKDHYDYKSVQKLAIEANSGIIYSFIKSKHSSDGIPIDNAKLSIAIADSDGNIIKRHFHDIVHEGPAEPLEIKYARVSKDIVKSLFEKDIKEASSKLVKHSKPFGIPDKIIDLPSRASSQIEHAAYLQLIAMLTPSMMVSERNYLFERSLVALEYVNPDSDYYNLLKSRALFHLYRRPTALVYLKDRTSPEEQALLEYLNGNYPELLEIQQSIKEPLLRAISFIELNELHQAYHGTGYNIASFQLPNSAWEYLLSSTSRDTDTWFVPNNIYYFNQLTGLFPEFDKMFAEKLKEQFASGNLKQLKSNEKLFDTIFNISDPLYSDFAGQIREGDIWRLYYNLFVANSLRDLNRSANVHANFQTAKKKAESLEPYFLGQSFYMQTYAQTLIGLAKNTEGTQRNFLNKKAAHLLIDLLYDDRSTNNITVMSYHLLSVLLNDKVVDWKAVRHINYSSGRKGFPSNILFHQAYGHPPALAYTNNRFNILQAAINKGVIDEKEFEQELESRFNGHPQKNAFVVNRLIDDGKTGEAKDLLEKIISNHSTNWEMYKLLANMFIDEEDFSQASETFLSYPYFKEIPDNERVLVSNLAEAAGSRFFWLGRYKEALPFYQIAISTNSGSGSQYIAQLRTSLIEGKYLAAIQSSYKSAERYNSSYRYRDYLGLLNLYGEYESSESAFRVLSKRFENPMTPHLWTAMFVGQRIQKKSMEDINQWVEDFYKSSNSENLKKQIQRYVFMQAIVDRDPSKSQTKVVEAYSLDNKTIWRRDASLLGKVFMDEMNYVDNNNYHCKKDRLCRENDKSPICLMKSCEINDELPSYAHNKYSGFLEAYSLFRDGHYDESLSKFVEMDYFDSNNASKTWRLPYIAMAASKSNSAGNLNELLKSLNKEGIEDDYNIGLTKAVNYALLDNIEESISSLKFAFNRRPHTEHRPIFTWYTVTEVAEWLYQLTQNKVFINIALQWAKNYQVIQPYFAWAYAFEARYSEIKEDRVRAAAFADYLDPQSKWLSEVPEAIRKEGVKWWESNNPFTIDTEQYNTEPQKVST